MGNDILVNIISDTIFLVILIILGWLFYNVTKRSKLLRFFGIEKSRRIVIYLSNLRIPSFSAKGIDGRKRSYEGSAGAFGEIHIATRFRDLFNYILPSLSDNPGILSKILISDVKIHLIQSPLKNREIENIATFIAFGTPAFNIASGVIEDRFKSQAHFELGVSTKKGDTKSKDVGHTVYPTTHSASVEDSSVTLSPSASGTASVYQETYLRSSTSGDAAKEPNLDERPDSIVVANLPPITDPTYGFVERLRDSEKLRNIFYIAGLSELSTVGAANFLMTNWQALQRKYGYETQFLIMLNFDPTDYQKGTIVFERQK